MRDSVADEIEDNVMRHLFETFGNPAAVKRAIEEATPNDDKVQEKLKRRQFIVKELERIERSRQKVIDLWKDDKIPKASADTQFADFSQRETRLVEERHRLDDELAHLPSSESVRQVSTKIAGEFRRYTNARSLAKARHANHEFDAMTYEEKRHLCELVFGGKLPDGRRMGIWVTWSEDGKKWRYRIEGHLIEATGPVSKGMFEFGAAPEQKALVTKIDQH